MKDYLKKIEIQQIVLSLSEHEDMEMEKIITTNDKVDFYFCEEIQNSFLETIKNQFKLENVSKTLNDFYYILTIEVESTEFDYGDGQGL